MTAPYKTAEEWRRVPQPTPSMQQIPMAMREMAEWGLHIFPCHNVKDGRCSCGNESCASPGKHPHLSRWQEIATTDQEQIARWIVRYPGCNWGCATGLKSGVIVMDIDSRHGGDESLASLEAQHGQITTWAALTGGGGRHLFFRHPGLGDIRNSASVIGPGIDVRGDGGFVIVPPSIHASGRPYAWDVDHHPDDEVLADLPDWIVARIDLPHIAAPKAPQEWRARVAEVVPEGKRNTRLAQLAGHLLRRRVDPYVALELLESWNATKCQPPLDSAELHATVDSIAGQELRRRLGDENAA